MLEQQITEYYWRMFHEEANSSGYYNHSTTSGAFSRNNLRSGSSVPNYKYLIGSHGNASSAYTRFNDKLTFTRGFCRLDFQYGFISSPSNIGNAYWLVDGDFSLSAVAGTFLGAPSYDVSSNSRNRLNVKFLLKAREFANSQSGVFLAEFGETLHMIRHPAEALKVGLGAYLDTAFKRARGVSKALTRSKRIRAMNDIVSNTWLEHHYGWKPLISDISQGINAYGRLFDPRFPAVKRVSASVKDMINSTDTRYVTPAGTSFSCRVDITDTNEIEAMLIGNVVFSCEQPVSFGSSFGFTPQDVTPTIWNLIPYSVVVDYFANIGDCLEAAVTPTNNIRFLVLSTRSKRKYYASGSFDSAQVALMIGDGTGDYRNPYVSTSSDSANFDQFCLRRDMLDPETSLWVLPSFTFSPPATQIGNCIALVAQALGYQSKLRSIGEY